MNRNLGGFEIPVSWKDSLQSFWIILFSGVMATLWTKLGDTQPKTPLKFALSLFISASATSASCRSSAPAW